MSVSNNPQFFVAIFFTATPPQTHPFTATPRLKRVAEGASIHRGCSTRKTNLQSYTPMPSPEELSPKGLRQKIHTQSFRCTLQAVASSIHIFRLIVYACISQNLKMTAGGFEPTPFQNGALSCRLKSLGQAVLTPRAEILTVW